MRRPLERVRILRRTDDQPTLPTRVKRILRKFPSAMVLPGPAVPILGPNLVANGEFAENTAGWLARNGATLTVDSGALRLLGNGSTGYPGATYSVVTEVGKTYQVSASVVAANAAPVIVARHGSYGITTGQATNLPAWPVGSASFSIQATATSIVLGLEASSGSAAFDAKFDSVAIREILGYQNTYSSFVAGNYRESTGQNLASVDQQIGLVVDAASPAIQIAGGLSAFSPVGGLPNISLAPGSFTTTQPSLGVTIPCIVGKWYRVSVAGSTTSDIFSVNTYDTTPARTEIKTGFGVCVFKADRPFIYLRNLSPGTTTLAALSVEELPGIHASQATSGYQSYMRQVPKTLGPELVSNGAFDAADGWSMGAGWGISGGTLNHHAPSTLTSVLAVATQVGKTYQCSYSITSQSAAGSGVSLRVGSTNLTIRNGVGTYSETLTQAVDSATVGFIARGGSGDWLGSIDNLSVREVLEWTYAWQLDGVDDRMSFSAVPFGTSDDFVMISGCRPAAALDMTIIGLGNSGQTNPAIVLGTLPSGQPRMWARNDAGTFVQVQGPSSVVGSDVVLTGRKKGSVMELRVNGVAAPTAAWPANSMAINTATLGALTRTTVGGFFSGHLHPQIMINGAPSDAEIGVLERFIARWQGRNL